MERLLDYPFAETRRDPRRNVELLHPELDRRRNRLHWKGNGYGDCLIHTAIWHIVCLKPLSTRRCKCSVPKHVRDGYELDGLLEFFCGLLTLLDPEARCALSPAGRSEWLDKSQGTLVSTAIRLAHMPIKNFACDT